MLYLSEISYLLFHCDIFFEKSNSISWGRYLISFEKSNRYLGEVYQI